MTKRKISNFKRLCIPQKFCKVLDFAPCEQVEITIEYGFLCIKKFNPHEINKRPYIGIVKNLDSQHCVRLPSSYLELLNMKPHDYVKLEVDSGEKKIKISSI